MISDGAFVTQAGVLAAGQTHYVGRRKGGQMGSVVFWGSAAVMLLGVALLLLRAARATAASGGGDVQLYKDQLADVDRDVARGVLTQAEAAALRIEVSRRILAADRQQAADGVQGNGAVLAGVIALILAGGVWGYVQLGAPGYPDVPLADRIAAAEELRAKRPSQEVAERQVVTPVPVEPDADYAALMDRLRAAVAARPDDQQGLALLAQNEAALGNFAAARTAQKALIAAKGDAATADDHANLAEMLVAAASGYVSPEAEAILEQALQRDANNAKARYYAGLMLAQVGRYDLSFRLWKPIAELQESWTPALRAQIEEVALRAGVTFTLPDVVGPTAADMAAAADMSPADRQAMIAGMVGQLSDRLATEGGPAADWARLITSLGVLGQTEQARAILLEARTTFAANAPDLAVINAAAAEAGL